MGGLCQHGQRLHRAITSGDEVRRTIPTRCGPAPAIVPHICLKPQHKRHVSMHLSAGRTVETDILQVERDVNDSWALEYCPGAARHLPTGEDFRDSEKKRISDRMEIVRRALDLGLVIDFLHCNVRLFRAGQTARMASGYFELDEARLMRSTNPSGHRPCVYADADEGCTWAWLRAAVASMSQESVARIAAACAVRQAWPVRPAAVLTTQNPQSNSNVLKLRRD